MAKCGHANFIEYPKCYRTIDVENDECLVLEDLCSHGFTTINGRKNEITANHVNLVMEVLSKFHAISFALNDQEPETFNKLTANLSEVFISRANRTLRFYLNNQSALVFEAVATEEDLLAKVKEFYKREAVDTAADCIDIELSASVISYGDVWQNNIMFSYNNEGEPIEARFLDWQAVRHSSPVIDIAFFIFCCTTKELRDLHYDTFLKVYHDSLSAHIRKYEVISFPAFEILILNKKKYICISSRLGSDPEKLFPYTLMLEHLRQCAKYGFILSTVILPVITTETEYTLDLDELGECAENGTLESGNMLISERSLKTMHKRLRDIVADMVRLGYI